MIPKTRVAFKHKAICLLQTKNMLHSQDNGIKLDKTSMFMTKKGFKKNEIIQEIPLNPFINLTTPKKTIFLEPLSQKTRVLFQKINERVEKSPRLHENKNKKLFFKSNFAGRKQNSQEFSLENSIKIRKLDPFEGESLFFLSKTVNKTHKKILSEPICLIKKESSIQKMKISKKIMRRCSKNNEITGFTNEKDGYLKESPQKEDEDLNNYVNKKS